MITEDSSPQNPKSSRNQLPWHEAAQAYLEFFGLSTPTASLIYSLAALSFCWFLLWLLWRKRVFIKV
jgi:hypothetical protein